MNDHYDDVTTLRTSRHRIIATLKKYKSLFVIRLIFLTSFAIALGIF